MPQIFHCSLNYVEPLVAVGAGAFPAVTTPGDSGKTVYFCLRYENQKGGEEGEGPFGPIMSAIIP
jgi:hypothetical protein